MLALVGRLDVRDWVDIVECSERLQPLGYLAWAACGKDPGFSPLAILEQAGRSAHYSANEVASLAFEGDAPDAADLSRRFRMALGEARTIIEQLPEEQVGTCVTDETGKLYTGNAFDLRDALRSERLRFRAGSIRGAWPTLVTR